MTAAFLLLHICIFLFMPWALQELSRRTSIGRALGEVVLCYAAGILIGNSSTWWLGSDAEAPVHELKKNFSEISVLLAIPILLMLNHVRTWLKYTGNLLLCFSLGALSMCTSAIFAAWYFWDSIADSSKAASMLAAVFIGGTPNMASIQKGLGVDENVFITLNATDIFCSTLYLLFLTSIARSVFGLLLPEFRADSSLNQAKSQAQEDSLEAAWLQALKASLYSLAVVGSAVALGFLFADAEGKPNMLLVMLALTSLGLACSFFASCRRLKRGAEPWGNYLLLIFAISIGSMADFGQLWQEGSSYIGLTALVLFVGISLHWFLSALFGIDRDSFIMSSTAGIFGPPFVSQMGMAIQRPQLIAAAMALGVAGLAIGNYLGFALYSLLQLLLD